MKTFKALLLSITGFSLLCSLQVNAKPSGVKESPHEGFLVPFFKVEKKIKGLEFFQPYYCDFEPSQVNGTDLAFANWRIVTKDKEVIPIAHEEYRRNERTGMPRRSLMRSPFFKQSTHKLWIPMNDERFADAKVKRNYELVGGPGKTSRSTFGAGGVFFKTRQMTVRRDTKPYNDIAHFVGVSYAERDSNRSYLYAVFCESYLGQAPNLKFQLSGSSGAIDLKCEALSELRNSEMSDLEKMLRRQEKKLKSTFHPYRILLPKGVADIQTIKAIAVANQQWTLGLIEEPRNPQIKN